MSEFLVLCIGVLQIVAGIIVLVWAWPLFADPPFLSQGLVKEYHDLRQTLPRDDATLATLKGLRWKLEWLFLHQTEGVFFGMASGTLLVMCGSALMGLTCWPRVSRMLRRKR